MSKKRKSILVVAAALFVASALAQGKPDKVARSFHDLSLGMSTAEMLEVYPQLSLLVGASGGELQTYVMQYEEGVPYLRLCVGLYKGEIFGIWLVYDGAHAAREMKRGMRHQPHLMRQKLQGREVDRKNKWQDERTLKSWYPLAAAAVPLGVDVYVMSLVDAAGYNEAQEEEGELIAEYWWTQ